MPWLGELCAAFCAALLESSPFVVLGLVIAGLFHEFVPAKMLRRGAGGRSLGPVLRVVGVGALLPICSCSTIPLGIGLTRSGASIGTALAFMTSSPAISPVTVALGLGILGPMLLGWYSLLAIGGAVLLGYLGNQWLGETTTPEPEPHSCGCSGCGQSSHTNRLLKAMRWAFGDLGPEVSESLALGLVAASVVLVALPDGVVQGWLAEPNGFALLAAVAVALPAYTCSVPSLVIAGSLLARGVDPSVAVTFLIAGPATNLGELNAIRSAMGGRAATFYAGSLIAIALLAGAATAWLPEVATPAMSGHAGHNHDHAIESIVLGTGVGPALADAATWRWPFVACLVASAGYALVGRIRKWTRAGQTESKPHATHAIPTAPALHDIERVSPSP